MRQCPGANQDETRSRDYGHRFHIDELGKQAASKHSDCTGKHQRGGGAEEDNPLVYRLVGSEQQRD
ncbi:MAG TPA: hypothetical protein VKN35_08850, partial [Xanthomonadales bacterium]|nr:hypothetical protein [Xanthomonadales bacterium]